MATKEELVDTLTTNAIKAYDDAGGNEAAKLGDFNDESYEGFDGGEAVEQAVVEELLARGFVVSNVAEGSRIFARTQAEIDTYTANTGIETTPDA